MESGRTISVALLLLSYVVVAYTTSQYTKLETAAQLQIALATWKARSVLAADTQSDSTVANVIGSFTSRNAAAVDTALSRMELANVARSDNAPYQLTDHNVAIELHSSKEPVADSDEVQLSLARRRGSGGWNVEVTIHEPLLDVRWTRAIGVAEVLNIHEFGGVIATEQLSDSLRTSSVAAENDLQRQLDKVLLGEGRNAGTTEERYFKASYSLLGERVTLPGVTGIPMRGTQLMLMAGLVMCALLIVLRNRIVAPTETNEERASAWPTQWLMIPRTPADKVLVVCWGTATVIAPSIALMSALGAFAKRSLDLGVESYELSSRLSLASLSVMLCVVLWMGASIVAIGLVSGKTASARGSRIGRIFE